MPLEEDSGFAHIQLHVATKPFSSLRSGWVVSKEELENVLRERVGEEGRLEKLSLEIQPVNKIDEV
jgi:hypothetical protein